MTGRLYTVEEANALLPHLAPALVELREKFEEAAEARVLVARAAAGNGWSEKRDRWARVLGRVTELLERLQEWEVELKDVSTGLVDFPAVVEGEEAYLCWRLGEPEVAFWHRRQDGFRGRRPLPPA
ncbi:MAG TPA: DUF2203 domain-containing protein [Actinomycetota bacterium]|jgi:hypothetical protein|nr:DUF2203 domain-containing protein [Actinomycetota bacterium]